MVNWLFPLLALFRTSNLHDQRVVAAAVFRVLVEFLLSQPELFLHSLLELFAFEVLQVFSASVSGINRLALYLYSSQFHVVPIDDAIISLTNGLNQSS